MMRLAAGLAAALALVLGACSSPDPVLYVVAPVQGVRQAGGPAIVTVRDVSLARYLQRSQIVRSSENYRLDVMANEWWGEPLGPMLTRVLVEELGQRLPGSTVYGENGAVSTTQDATVELNIQRLDEDASGRLVLSAQAAVVFEKSRAAPRARSFRIVKNPPRAGVPGEVAAISAAFGEVADGVAAVLRRHASQ